MAQSTGQTNVKNRLENSTRKLDNKPKPRVLFVTRKFPPSTGGMEYFAFELSQALRRKTDLRLIKYGRSNKYLPLVLVYFFVRTLWILSTQRIDVIHIQDGLLAPMGVFLKTIFRKPLVVIIHGLDVTYKNSIYQTVVPAALKRADKVICISQVAAHEVVKRGIPAEKVTFLPLGMTDRMFLPGQKEKSRRHINKELHIPAAAKVILSVGRLVERKGVRWFIDQVMPKLIADSDPSLILLVSGEGSYRQQIEATIRKRKLKGQVKLLGRTNNELLRHLYNGADIFIMPNISVPGDMEGFGLVLLEASLCQLPIVASGIEGVNDAIKNGTSGFLMKERDSDQFAKTIHGLLTNDDAAHKLGKKSRAYTLEYYSWPKIADDYVMIYHNLLE